MLTDLYQPLRVRQIALPVLLAMVFALNLPVQAELIHQLDAEGVLHLYTPEQWRANKAKTSPLPAPSPYKRRAPEELLATIHGKARNAKVDHYLVEAVVAVESAFNPIAVSPKGARGLMQLMPGTAKRFEVADSFNVEENLRGGITYLKYLLGLFKNNLRLALAAYNAGENAVMNHRGIPPYRETQDYVRKVMKLYETLKKNAPPEPPQLVRARVRPGEILITNAINTVQSN